MYSRAESPLPALMLAAAVVLSAVLVVVIGRDSRAQPDITLMMPSRVVIVGAGLGGASCAYHLKKQVPDAKVTILEAGDRTGGRIKDVEFFGRILNEGAAVYNSFQKNIAELVAELDVPTIRFTGDPLGAGNYVWDGHKLSEPRDLLIQDPAAKAALEATVKDFLVSLALNYKATDERVFRSVGEFLKAGGLDVYTEQSAAKFFRDTPVSEAIQKYYLEPYTRIYFGQGLSSSAILTMLSLSGTFEDALKTEGGMSRLVEATLNAADCDVQLNSPVRMVTKTADGTFEVTYDQGKGHVTTPADVVVIAAPFEQTGIKFEGFKIDPAADQPIRQWQRLYYVKCCVAAKSLRASQFKEPEGASPFNPTSVLTTANTSQPWVAIRSSGASRGYNLYSVYASEDLAESGRLQEIFEDVQDYKCYEWGYVYPINPAMRHDGDYQSMVLADRLYSLNGLESVATQMETAVTGGRNIAKLIAEEM